MWRSCHVFLLIALASCVPEKDEAGDPRLAGDAAMPADAEGAPDGGPLAIDAGEPDGIDASADAGVTPAEDAGALVDVAHPRELRAVWIATVANINFPSRQGLSAAAQQAELIEMVDTAASINLNALVFQVRPESDALYRSELEPWSRFLTGTQGGDPGYDPLEFLIDLAHERSLEVHAWLNPYRAKTNAATTAVLPHISLVASEYAYSYGNLLWMDPAAEIVRQRTVDVVEDLVTRYDLDGVHFDDYFYPYPDGSPFPDDATYADYQAAGGAMTLGDWRRDNVHQLVRLIAETIARTRPHVRFGISPFGIYRPGMPPGIVGLDQYTAIYSDPLVWMNEGWVDYLAPQLYWPTTQTAQAYEPLIEWWAATSVGGRYIFSGNFLSRLGENATWSVDEFRAQLDHNRRYLPEGGVGEFFFQIDPLLENRDGIADVLRAEYYARPALSPVLTHAIGEELAPPAISVEAGTLAIGHPDAASLRAWVLYRRAGDAYEVDSIHAPAPAIPAPPAGEWAVSAADKRGVESRGVLVRIE